MRTSPLRSDKWEQRSLALQRLDQWCYSAGSIRFRRTDSGGGRYHHVPFLTVCACMEGPAHAWKLRVGAKWAARLRTHICELVAKVNEYHLWTRSLPFGFQKTWICYHNSFTLIISWQLFLNLGMRSCIFRIPVILVLHFINSTFAE